MRIVLSPCFVVALPAHFAFLKPALDQEGPKTNVRACSCLYRTFPDVTLRPGANFEPLQFAFLAELTPCRRSGCSLVVSGVPRRAGLPTTIDGGPGQPERRCFRLPINCFFQLELPPWRGAKGCRPRGTPT